jgi:hypothetical protein
MNDGVQQKIKNFVKNYGQNIDITIIIQLLIYFFTLYFFPLNSLFTNMLTIDSSITALRFIKTLYESDGQDLMYNFKMNELKENDMMMRKLKDYIGKFHKNHTNKFMFTNDGKIRFFEKYFLFGACQLISTLIQTILWTFNSFLIILLNSVLLIFSIPLFYILITSCTYFLKLLAKTLEHIKKVINYVMSKISANIINKLTESTLNTNPHIVYVEMLDYYEDFGNSVIKTLSFIKTVISLSLLYYFKKTDNTVYSYIANIIQKYQTESLIPIPINKITSEEKQKKILEIITKRRWDEFLKPKTVNILFELYENNNDSKENDSFSNKIGMVLRNLKINFHRFITIWSIAMVSPILALVVDIYYTYIDNKFFIKNNIYAYGIASILLLFNNPLIGGILMVASDYFIKPLLEYLDENGFFSKFIIRNADQLKYLGILLSVTKITYLGFLIPILIHYVNRNKKLTIITFSIIFLNMLSGFSMFHLIALWGIGNIVHNIYSIDRQQNKQNVVHLVENYLDNPINKFTYLETIKVTEGRREKKLEDDDKKNKKGGVCDMVTGIFYFRSS